MQELLVVKKNVSDFHSNTSHVCYEISTGLETHSSMANHLLALETESILREKWFDRRSNTDLRVSVTPDESSVQDEG